jgi:UDP-glucose 4-epimerase
VPSCEFFPEAVRTNVGGTQNVIRAAASNGVQKLYAYQRTSSLSINAMGISKTMMEKSEGKGI